MSLEKEERMIRQSFRTKSLFACLFIFTLVFASAHVWGQVSEVEVYNFIKKARTAKWERYHASGGQLPFNGPNTDKRGYVRYLNGAVLEV